MSAPPAADVERKTAGVIETDLPSRLDRLPWGRFHTLIVVALGVTWLLDGLEVTLAGSVASALKSSAVLRFSQDYPALASARRTLESVSLSPNEAQRHGLKINLDGVRRSGFDLLSFPDVSFADLGRIWPELGVVECATAGQVEIDAKGNRQR